MGRPKPSSRGILQQPSAKIAVPARVYAALGCALLVAAGCSSGVPEDAGVEATSGAGSLALLHIERQADTASGQPRVTSSVKVARYRGIDGDRLLRLLGAETRDLDTCTLASGLDDQPLPLAAHVELVSVGTIGLRLGDEPHLLAPRLFPALATTASGFFYADAFDSDAEASELGVTAAGQAGIGRFDFALPVPEMVVSLRLAGEDASESVSIVRARDAELAWETGAGEGHLEIELFVGGSVLACTARDDGSFVLPRGKLELLDADDNAALLVRRVRVTPVDVHGVESAYARVASARSFSAQLR